MKRIAKQNGIALLAFALLLVVGLSTILVNKLETNTTFYERQLQNTEILKEAKQALIGYAINFPEAVNPDLIGGYLPCPDINNTGFSVGSCSEGGNTNIGLFPHETVETQEFLDASGENLWYALSQNFRNNPRTNSLNSETLGTLSVDNSNDIVAVLIAAGEPLATQSRSGLGSDPRAVITEYLDEDNNDFDANFISAFDGDFNDRLVFITRKEIMEAIEKRVLKYLEEVFTNYYNDPDQDGVASGNEFYPWLSSFSNPETSAFKSSLNTYEGHIPFHYSLDIEPNRNPFLTNLTIEWSTITNSITNFMGTVEESCLLNIDCIDSDISNGNIPQITNLDTTAPVNCTWSDRETVDCEAIVITRVINSYLYEPLCAPGDLVRTYTLNFPSFSSSNVAVTAPTTANIRTRQIQFSGSIPDMNNAIQIQDLYTGEAHNGIDCSTNVIDQDVGSGSLSFSAGITEANITVSNIRYDLDVDNGELEEWFVDNEWYKYIYIAYANSSIDATPGECIDSNDCLSIQNTNDVFSEDDRIIAIATGEALDFQIRPSNNLIDYLENENANSAIDNLLEERNIDSAFNDQLNVILEN